MVLYSSTFDFYSKFAYMYPSISIVLAYSSLAMVRHHSSNIPAWYMIDFIMKRMPAIRAHTLQ